MNILKKTLLTSTCSFLLLNTAIATEKSPIFSTLSVDGSDDENSPFYSIKCSWLKNSSENGRNLSLGDESQWRVDTEYQAEVNTWKNGDPLVLSPNYNPFSTNNYWFRNLRTNTYALVDILKEPFEMGPHSHRISSFASDGSLIFLQNHIGFEIDRRDRWLSEEWLIDDHIILGVSNVWFGSCELILFNVNLNHHVRAKIHK